MLDNIENMSCTGKSPHAVPDVARVERAPQRGHDAAVGERARIAAAPAGQRTAPGARTGHHRGARLRPGRRGRGVRADAVRRVPGQPARAKVRGHVPGGAGPVGRGAGRAGRHHCPRRDERGAAQAQGGHLEGARLATGRHPRAVRLSEEVHVRPGGLARAVQSVPGRGRLRPGAVLHGGGAAAQPAQPSGASAAGRDPLHHGRAGQRRHGPHVLSAGVQAESAEPARAVRAVFVLQAHDERRPRDADQTHRGPAAGRSHSGRNRRAVGRGTRRSQSDGHVDRFRGARGESIGRTRFQQKTKIRQHSILEQRKTSSENGFISI